MTYRVKISFLFYRRLLLSRNANKEDLEIMTTTYLINKKGHTAYWEAVEELKIHLASRGMYINTVDYGKIPLMDIEEMLGKPKNIPVGIENEGESKHHSYLQYIKTFSTIENDY